MCRVRIPNPGRAGKIRPISIPMLADKVPHRVVLMVLESVYKQGFLECLRGICQINGFPGHKAAIS